MTEDLTLGKYPAYAKFQEATSRLIPLWSSTSATVAFAKSLGNSHASTPTAAARAGAALSKSKAQ